MVVEHGVVAAKGKAENNEGVVAGLRHPDVQGRRQPTV
jgi:hypothetical protein